VSFQKIIKTLRENGCEVDADGSAATPANKATQTTPKTGKTTGSGKKTTASRKKRLEEESDDEMSTPSKKPRTAAAAKVKAEAADEKMKTPPKKPRTNGKVKKEDPVKTEDDELVARAVQRVACMDESAFTDLV
jgi:hypothetical protein